MLAYLGLGVGERACDAPQAGLALAVTHGRGDKGASLSPVWAVDRYDSLTWSSPA